MLAALGLITLGGLYASSGKVGGVSQISAGMTVLADRPVVAPKCTAEELAAAGNRLDLCSSGIECYNTIITAYSDDLCPIHEACGKINRTNEAKNPNPDMPDNTPRGDHAACVLI